MSPRLLIALVSVGVLLALATAGGGGGHHKKVIIHVPLYIKHHHHKHTIVKHIHHKHKHGDGDDHFEVLGYTYGEPKAAPHGGGHAWGAAEDSHDAGYGGETPVSFVGDLSSYGASAGGDEHGY